MLSLQKNIRRTTLKGTKHENVFQNNLFTLSKKQLRSFKFFCYGFIIYTIGFVISWVSRGEIFTPDTSQGIQLAGLIVLIWGAAELMQYKFDDTYLQTIFSLYIIHAIIILVRVNDLSYATFKDLLFNLDYTAFIYLAPLVILFPRNLMLYKKLFISLFLLGIVFIIFSVLYLDVVLDPSRANNSPGQYAIECFFLYLSYPLSFVLLIYIYYSNPKKIFAFAIMILATYFIVFRARRGSLFMCLTTLLGVLMVYLIYTKKTAMIVFLSIFITLFFMLFLSNMKAPAFMDFLLSRSDEDTRTGVEMCMKADMTVKDWIIGKGMNGKYICPLPIDEQTVLTGKRGVIETGYLQTILTGGVLSLILMGLIIFPAIYKGLFKSKNILCKGAGIFMILWIVYQYPRIVVSFSMYYILIWILVGVCYSPVIRNMSDREIKKHLEF